MDELITLEINCPFCGRLSTVVVFASSYEEYQAGATVQEAFPYLSASDREIIISGICRKCQLDVFGPGGDSE